MAIKPFIAKPGRAWAQIAEANVRQCSTFTFVNLDNDQVLDIVHLEETDDTLLWLAEQHALALSMEHRCDVFANSDSGDAVTIQIINEVE